MLKVSLVNWLISLIMLTSHFFKKNILEYFFDFAMQSNKNNLNNLNNLNLPKIIARRLNLAWGLFFMSLGFLNLYIAFNCSLNTWVNFKVFGVIGLTLAFTAAQTVYLYKYLK